MGRFQIDHFEGEDVSSTIGMSERAFEITNMTKGKLPRLPFLDIKEEILGKKYDLSLVIIGDARSQSLNKKYRGKSKPANILSFPLGSNDGEMFINMRKVVRDARRDGLSTKKMLGFLFIHGLLHLEGMPHGSKMEAKERAFQKKFSI